MSEILQPTIFWFLRHGETDWNARGLSQGNVDIPLNDESRQRLRRVLENIDRSIEQGFLPAAPQTGACALCDYSAVCGPYEETRVKRKQADRLDPLIEIRHSP